MLAALSDPSFPALALLRTRDSTDFSIALLDAWAVALDILTFYQERFANEAFLRTAVDQRSVIELAAPGRLPAFARRRRLRGAGLHASERTRIAGQRRSFRPAPGCRASPAPARPRRSSRPPPTSPPSSAGTPCRPRQLCPWPLGAGDTSTWITGTANNINPGDALLFIRRSYGNPSTTGPGRLPLRDRGEHRSAEFREHADLVGRSRSRRRSRPATD